MNWNKHFDLIIEPNKAERNYWRDLWRYRELFYFLSWRDILIRYKQTTIGVAWSLLRPLLTMIIFTLVFKGVAKMVPPPGVPYPVLIYVALLPWQFFSNALSESSNSLVSNANLISKVYFPRLIVPASAVIVSFVDFAISFVLLLGLMIIYQFVPSWQMIFLPLLLVLTFFTAFGVGLWLTALNVRFRDFRYVIPFIVQFGLFVSPVGYDSSTVPEKWQLLYSLNPMVGIIDGFRWAIIGGDYPLPVRSLAVATVFASLMTFVAIRYFRKTEKTFADII
jgi:lipopolysaccharide transport system permease protein